MLLKSMGKTGHHSYTRRKKNTMDSREEATVEFILSDMPQSC